MSGDAAFSNTVILLTRNGMGSGETELQHDLFAKYLRLLIESGSLPAAMCFYTDGVRLVVEGSPFQTGTIADAMHIGSLAFGAGGHTLQFGGGYFQTQAIHQLHDDSFGRSVVTH